MSVIPGQTAKHAIITANCRAKRTDMGAFDEAARRLRGEYEALLPVWASVEGAQFHVALTVERPG